MSTPTSHRHILPIRVYLSVAAALLIFTAITVTAAQIHFGAFNLLIAMVIAAIKATLVLLFFMHLKYDSRVYATVFVGAILVLAVFIIFTMFDTLRRGDIYDEVAHPLHDARIYHHTTTPTDTTHTSSGAAKSSDKPAESGH